MRWKLGELLYELAQDRERRVLFVEGSRDLAFWRSLVPDTERGNTVVYPISHIETPGAAGGERGRMIRVATDIAEKWPTCRIIFFVDADTDRICGTTLPPNVIMTDGRDLESYCLSTRGMEEICVSGLGRNDDAASMLSVAERVCRPIGILRVRSMRRQWNLPFQRTISEKTIRKFVLHDCKGLYLNVDRLCTALLQNGQMTLARKASVMSEYEQEGVALRAYPDCEIVHGKDLIISLALYLNCTSEHIESMMFLAIRCDIEEIRKRPNLQAAEKWVRMA